MKPCPECKSEIPSDAQVCYYCTNRIEGVLCPDCKSYCPEDAKVCKWCHKKLAKDKVVISDQDDILIVAETLPSVLLELTFIPQKVSFTQEKITITSYSLFGFISKDEEIPWQKVAGFSHKSGLIWDTIFIETRGQTGGVIKPLSKENSRKIRSILQKLEI
jgi:RNA polymerase subunit RPABC4/transcription elongation factor Spt4